LEETGTEKAGKREIEKIVKEKKKKTSSRRRIGGFNTDYIVEDAVGAKKRGGRNRW
jgi:hypothetical protein